MCLEGQVDQLEDRYLGMVEASGSNPDLSISALTLTIRQRLPAANLFYLQSNSLIPKEI